MIYVSTGGFNNHTVEHSIQLLQNFQNIEVSGGRYNKEQVRKIIEISSKKNILLHNYAPPPETPFVLNLGSLNPEIEKLSYEHILNAIQLTHQISGKFYAIHAPYAVDPQPAQMGKPLQNLEIADYTEVLQKFCRNYSELRKYATQLNIELLVENNVMTSQNLKNLTKYGLTFCDNFGANELIRHTQGEIGFLIDFAHLEISSRALNFDVTHFLNTCEQYTRGIHLSETCGTKDDNKKIHKNSFLFKYKEFWKNYPYITVEVYGSCEEIGQSFEEVSNALQN